MSGTTPCTPSHFSPVAASARRPQKRGWARKAIQDAIEANPGVNKTALARTTGLAWGTVVYHVDRLECDGCIQVLGAGRSVALFPATYHTRRMRWLAAVRTPEAVAVLRLLQQKRQVTVPSIMEDLGLSRGIARNRLQELEHSGLIERWGRGRPRFMLNRDQTHVVQQLTASP